MGSGKIEKILRIESSENILNIVAEKVYGKNYRSNILSMFQRFSGSDQVKFNSNNLINENINVIKQELGLSTLATVYQSDVYYGDDLKIRSTINDSERNLIFKMQNGWYAGIRIAFDIDKLTGAEVRETYQPSLNVGKDRTYFSSTDGLMVVRDRNIKIQPIIKDSCYLTNKNVDIKKIEESIEKANEYPGEIWEIHLPNGNLKDVYNRKMEQMLGLGFTIIKGKKYSNL